MAKKINVPKPMSAAKAKAPNGSIPSKMKAGKGMSNGTVPGKGKGYC